MSDSLGPDRTGTSDSVADDDGIELPSWIFNPRTKILGIVATWLVGGVLAIGEVGVGVVLDAGGVLAEVPALFFGSIADGFGSAGGAILATLESLNAAIVAAASSAGPLAPVILLVGYAALFLALIRGAMFVIDLVDVPVIDLGTLVRGVTAPIRTLRRWLT